MFSTHSKVNLDIVKPFLSHQQDKLNQYELVLDSRKVNSSSIFCAYPGTANDGRNFISTAIKQGAKLVIYEPYAEDIQFSIDSYPISGLMYYVGILAAYKYALPSLKFKTIGVTGTNGKTSITHWLNQVYSFFHKKTAIIGTTGSGVYPNIEDCASTTPGPITLQHLLCDFAKQNVDIAALEVSSHALDQGRVNGVSFDTAIFTNLTQDHLDYHHTLDNYYQAKRNLFYWHGLKHAIINIDDKYGQRLYHELKADLPALNLLSYGLSNAMLTATGIKITVSGMSFNLNYAAQSLAVVVKVVGRFNIYNLLAVAASLIADGYALEQIAAVLPHVKPVCGRMDAIMLANKPLIIVDYAHTPDALANALITLKEIEHSGKLYCIFGCGGNRDKSKRPLMGQIAVSIADMVVVSSDNPRCEVPTDIIQDIIRGIPTEASNYMVIEDRDLAIRRIIAKANANDIILIAGKGHETYQEIQGVKHQFSDFEIALNALNRK